MKNDILKKIGDHKFPLFFELIKWKIIDVYRAFKEKKPLHFYGVRCIEGLYGQGKTIAMTQIALDFRLRYCSDIYIATNYGLGIQDFPIVDIDTLSAIYDKPIIFLYDEVQNDFPSTNKPLDERVRKVLSLNRKGHGKSIFWVSQDAELVHKTFRRLTMEFGSARTLFSRYTRVRWYRKIDWEQLTNSSSVDNKMKIHPIKTVKFVQDDYIRSLYDSYGVDNGEQIIKVT